MSSISVCSISFLFPLLCCSLLCPRRLPLRRNGSVRTFVPTIVCDRGEYSCRAFPSESSQPLRIAHNTKHIMTTVEEPEATSGYWEPHTSSIDFCESNYAHTVLIAEVHNVWSSFLGLSAVGLFGLLRGNPTKEWRFTLVYLVLIVIGIGSACLHGTLHWLFQSSDELPMIYIVISLTYGVLECEAPKGQPRYPWLPAALLLLAVVNTAVYYTFQHLYLVFILTYSIMTIVATVGLVRLLFYREGRCPAAKKLFWIGEMWYSLIGVPVWALDMLLCHHLLPVADSMPGWALGMTPHVIWHCAAGMGAYLLTLSCCCCRAETLNLPYRLEFALGGILPIVTVKESTKQS